MVFVAGLGNSAHVFDDFAPRFTKDHRVLGVTRTGYGEGDQPEREGYDIASRVAHIRAALDAADVSKAVLVGHSLGGDEITAFAVTYPDRARGRRLPRCRHGSCGDVASCIPSAKCLHWPVLDGGGSWSGVRVRR